MNGVRELIFTHDRLNTNRTGERCCLCDRGLLDRPRVVVQDVRKTYDFAYCLECVSGLQAAAIVAATPMEESMERRELETMHPAVREMLKNFRYKHLPSHLQEVSRPFCELARDMAIRFPNGGAELTAGLRKLMESKDCMVRVALPPGPDDE